ncbi:MAG: hypothetical protein LPH21_00805 [Shewanella sp.]|nr:hypothetical protein [Shewanella sp.]
MQSESEVTEYPDPAQMANVPTTQNPQTYDPLNPAAGTPGKRMTPEELLLQRSGKHGKATDSQRSMRLRMVAKAMLLGADEYSMADQMGVSVQQIRKDVRKVREMFAKQAAEMDIHDYIGESMMFYKNVQYTALRMAGQTKATDGVKLASLRTALTSKADSVRLLKQAGVFDAQTFTSDRQEDKSEIEKLTELTAALLGMDMEEGELTPEDKEMLDALGANNIHDHDREDDDDDEDIRLI